SRARGEGEGRAQDPASPSEADRRRPLQVRRLRRGAMRIAVIGAGAMGAMFGARFADAGAEVVLFDRDDARVAALRETGLAVATPDGERGYRLPATSDPAEIGAADMALVMVDGNATAAVTGMLAATLPRAAFVLTLQNGIGNVE